MGHYESRIYRVNLSLEAYDFVMIENIVYYLVQLMSNSHLKNVQVALFNILLLPFSWLFRPKEYFDCILVTASERIYITHV